MFGGVLRIGFFNYKIALAGRVTLLRPTVIANEMSLLSILFSVAATGIPLPASVLCGSGSALVLVRFSLYY